MTLYIKQKMDFIKPTYFTIASILFVITNTTYAKNKTLPPILDYHPNCEYQILKSSISKSTTKDPNNTEFNSKLLDSLRERALVANADAVILTSKKIAQTTKNSRSIDYVYQISYKGDLIKLCEESNIENRKPAAYNHLGNKVLEIKQRSLKFTTSSVITPEIKEEYKNPVINNINVSLDEGIYGLKLGSSFEEVTSVLGKPNITLAGTSDEKVIGYGRHHWFYFQDNKFVKFESDLELLQKSILNKIPMLSFFDENKWLIENRITYKTSLADVKNSLNIYTKLDKNKQLKFRDKDQVLTLSFSNFNYQHDEPIYLLTGFAMESNTNKPTTLQIIDSNLIAQNESNFDALHQVFKQMQNNKPVNWRNFFNELGTPSGEIRLSNESNIKLYSPNLLFVIKDSELDTINLLEKSFFAEGILKSKTIAWQLGYFQSGQTLEEVKSFLPEGAFEYDQQVNIDDERYRLQLFFYQENGKNVLYESELKIKGA